MEPLTPPAIALRPRGFTLVEMLVVVVIIASLMVVALPALNSIATNYRITDTGARVAALIERGRMHATATQRVVALRLFQGNSASEFNAASLVEIAAVPDDPLATDTRPLAPAFRFPEPVIAESALSSLLDDGVAGSGSAALPGSGVRPFRDFRIFPDGSTSLPSTPINPYLGIVTRHDAPLPNGPNNPCVISIDPVTCRVTIYRR